MTASLRPFVGVEYGLRRVLVTVAVITATLLEIVDTTIVNVALPNIQGNFGVAVDQGAWIVTGYIVANVVVIPLTPWLAARFGRREYFFASVVLFTIASLMCGFAGSFGALVFWRIVQGLGGGGLISTAQAILRDTFPADQQGTAMGIFAMGVIVGPAVGPLLGGWMTDNLTWRWAFFINIPIGIASAILVWNYLRNIEKPAFRKLDWAGLGLLAAGLGAMQYVLDQGQTYDWFDDGNIRLLAFVSAASLIGFVWWTLRSKIPVVDLRVLRFREVAAGSVLGMVLGVSLYGSVFVLPQYLQGSLGFTATMSGQTMLVRALAIMLFTPATAMLAQSGKIDPRASTAVGFILLGISNWMLADVTTSNADFGTFVWPLVISGVGLSQIFVPLSLAVLGGLPTKEVPAASAFFNLSRQIGGSIATAVLITFLLRGFAGHQSALAAGVTNSQVATAQLLQSSPDRSTALAAIGNAVASQALIQSFADTSRWVAVISIALAPLVLLMKRPKMHAAPLPVE